MSVRTLTLGILATAAGGSRAARRSLRCLVGLHRWQYLDDLRGSSLFTLARCKRPACRYSAWSTVNVDELPTIGRARGSADD